MRVPESKRKGPRYTPLSKRQDRPNAILWLVRNHPELKDAQISRLVGTTKSTIEQIRERKHWNSANLQPMDPVTLGPRARRSTSTSRCSAPRAAASRRSRSATRCCRPRYRTAAGRYAEKPKDEDAELDADAVFAKLSSLKAKEPQPGEG